MKAPSEKCYLIRHKKATAQGKRQPKKGIAEK